MSSQHKEFNIFKLGDVRLQRGGALNDAQLAYRTFGELSAARDNAILMPTYYTGSHRECAHMVGRGRALDPERWFIIVINLIGNSVSTSPSNTSDPDQGVSFPDVTVHDNVHMQRRLLIEVFGIDELALVVGWSMGAQQAFEWAACLPTQVRAMAAICGSARTSVHNLVFLQGVKAALTADPDWRDGHYDAPPLRGLRAFGRVYAGWAYSQAFFRDTLYKELGFADAQALLDHWAEDHAAWDANDLLAMLRTWELADISANDTYQGDFQRALGAIRARSIVMPCATDLYFPVEDSELEVASMPNARLEVLQSRWGHIAGSPIYDAASKRIIDDAIAELLQQG